VGTEASPCMHRDGQGRCALSLHLLYVEFLVFGFVFVSLTDFACVSRKLAGCGGQRKEAERDVRVRESACSVRLKKKSVLVGHPLTRVVPSGFRPQGREGALGVLLCARGRDPGWLE